MSEVTDGEIIEVNCKDMLDELYGSYADLKQKNAGEVTFESDFKICQANILAVIASSLQRIANAIEDIRDGGVPSQ